MKSYSEINILRCINMFQNVTKGNKSHKFETERFVWKNYFLFLL